MRKTALLFLFAAGCEGSGSSGGPAPTPPAPPPKPEPDRITVQHILISFAGTRTKATRSKEDAEKLAVSLLDRVRKDEDFDALMKQYSDDTGPGVYPMANHGTPPGEAGEHPRGRMVAAFGNVGFKLEVGAIGMSTFDARESPFGWHIIKRLK